MRARECLEIYSNHHSALSRGCGAALVVKKRSKFLPRALKKVSKRNRSAQLKHWLRQQTASYHLQASVCLKIPNTSKRSSLLRLATVARVQGAGWARLFVKFGPLLHSLLKDSQREPLLNSTCTMMSTFPSWTKAPKLVEWSPKISFSKRLTTTSWPMKKWSHVQANYWAEKWKRRSSSLTAALTKALYATSSCEL